MPEQPRPVALAPRATTAYIDDSDLPPSRPGYYRPRIREGTCQITQEMTQLLRHRLRVAALIALIPNIYFLAQYALGLTAVPGWYQPFHTAIDVASTAILLVINAVVWSPRALTACTLRRLELALFGSLALLFAWGQVREMSCPMVLSWVPTDPVVEGNTFRLALLAGSLRWFFLLVLYGVFIPNPPRRCAAFVLTTAVLALGLTLGLGLMNERIRPHLAEPVEIVALVLGVASAIAIFGSHRIHGLQERANQAAELGRYRLLGELGSGGMGRVYRAEHSLLRRPCAIKVIHPENAADPGTLERFEREVRAMAGLTHPNTVEIYDYGRSDAGDFYYVMEYLPGMNLEAVVERTGSLPAARVVHLLRQVCGALREAHQFGLLHRDIKPSNMIVCQRGGIPDVVKLLDFGLVQNLKVGNGSAKLTMQGAILGSPPFISPEQARGRNDLTPATDVYGMGGVAYFLLTGHPPFERQTAMELFIAHANERPVPPSQLQPGVPADLEAVVLRCLEKDPTRRFADAEALGQALASCACAGEWAESQARVWWEEHGKQAGSDDGQTETFAEEITPSLTT